MTQERFIEIIKNAIIAYEFELEQQDYPDEKSLHECLLNEFNMTEVEYKAIMERY